MEYEINLDLLSKDLLWLEFVQNKLLFCVAFFLNNNCSCYDYSHIEHTFLSPPYFADLHIIYSLLNDSVDATCCLFHIPFCAPSYFSTDPTPFYIPPTRSTSYEHNRPWHRTVRRMNDKINEFIYNTYCRSN